jgi:hypothetical protein
MARLFFRFAVLLRNGHLPQAIHVVFIIGVHSFGYTGRELWFGALDSDNFGA